jgi:hypothetical protein
MMRKEGIGMMRETGSVSAMSLMPIYCMCIQMPTHPLCGQTSKLYGQGGCEGQKFAVGVFQKKRIGMVR